MKFNIAVISGDGIGPEVTMQAVKTLNAVGEAFNHDFIYTEALLGACAMDKTGTPLPDETIAICKKSDAVLFGAIGDSKYDNDPTAKVRPEQGLLKLRKDLGLFCNIRPVKVYDKLIKNSPLKEEVIKGTDIVFYRELTGGIYFGKKELSKDGKEATDECKYTIEEIERITHLAFKAAQKRRKKLTLVDKAHVLETSRLWRKTVADIAVEYNDVTLNFLYVENAATQLILNPTQFDVVLTANLFGDIISDEGSVIGGSIGLLASASIGEKNALFEPIHGAFHEAKGKDIANPLAAILSVAMLLEYLGLLEEAKAVEAAIEESLTLGVSTADINKESPFSTSKVGDFIASSILNPDDGPLNLKNLQMGQSTFI